MWNDDFPKRIKIKEGKLFQKPVKEIENYYVKTKLLFNIKIPKTLTKYNNLSSRLMDIELEIKYEKNCQFEIRIAANETIYTSIIFNSRDSTIIFDRNNSLIKQTRYNIRTIQLPNNDYVLKLRFLMDKYSIELFINNVELTSTNIIKTPINIDGIYMKSKGDIKVNIIQHQLGNFKKNV